LKLSTEINQLLGELVDIERIDFEELLKGNMGLIYHNLIELYSKTSNQKSDFEQALLNEEKGTINLTEEEFMDLLPVNAYFH